MQKMVEPMQKALISNVIQQDEKSPIEKLIEEGKTVEAEKVGDVSTVMTGGGRPPLTVTAEPIGDEGITNLIDMNKVAIAELFSDIKIQESEITKPSVESVEQDSILKNIKTLVDMRNEYQGRIDKILSLLEPINNKSLELPPTAIKSIEGFMGQKRQMDSGIEKLRNMLV